MVKQTSTSSSPGFVVTAKMFVPGAVQVSYKHSSSDDLFYAYLSSHCCHHYIYKVNLGTFPWRRQVKLIDNRKKVTCAELENTIYLKIEFVLIVLFLFTFIKITKHKLTPKYFR